MSTIETYNGGLQIPRWVGSRAFLEIAANVLSSPVLKSKIKTWVVPGRDMKLAEAAWDPDFIVPAELCPILVLWPVAGGGEPTTNIRQQATLNVRITLWVATVDPLDCMDLYGQVEAALSKDTEIEGRALQARLQAITGWSGTIEIDSPAVAGDPQATGGPVMMARSSVSTRYNIPSF